MWPGIRPAMLREGPRFESCHPTHFFYFFSLEIFLLKIFQKFSTPSFTGTASLSKKPKAFKFVLCSNVIFNTPTKGINKTIPEIPHSQPPRRMAKITAKALTFTLDPTTNGVIRLFSKSWIPQRLTKVRKG